MPRIYHSILGVQVFRLLWCVLIFRCLQPPSILCECSRFGMPSILASPVFSGSPPLFAAPSTASICTSVFCGAATRSTFLFRSSFPLLRNILAILACTLLCYKTLCPAFCLVCGKSVFSAFPWLSSWLLRELGYMHPFCSFPAQSQETEISD